MKAEVALGKKNLEQMVQDRLMTAVPYNFWTIEMSCFRGGPSNPPGGNHVQSPAYAIHKSWKSYVVPFIALLHAHMNCKDVSLVFPRARKGIEWQQMARRGDKLVILLSFNKIQIKHSNIVWLKYLQLIIIYYIWLDKETRWSSCSSSNNFYEVLT